MKLINIRFAPPVLHATFIRRSLTAFALSICILVASLGRAEAKGISVRDIPLKPNTDAKLTGDLKKGSTVELDWAAKSSVACFPATQNDRFSGNHLLYRMALPAHSVLSVKLTPKNKKSELSLYAYSVGKGDRKTLPPNINSVVSCEAAAGSDGLVGRMKRGAPRKLALNSTANSYTAYIGVAAADGLNEGKFTLEFSLKTAAPKRNGRVDEATDVTLKENGVVRLKDDLEGAPTVSLNWAARSNVACFPATQNEHFSGAQRLYRVELPPNSELTATATSRQKDMDVSLYAYSVGKGDKKTLPPNVTRVVSCEAAAGGKKINSPFNPGASETVRLNATKNPYTAYVGVTAAKGVTAGAFELQLDLKVRAPEPEGAVKSAIPLKLDIGKKLAESGKIDGGPEISLRWAANSSVACFPATRNEHFNGAHVLYSVPLPAHSELTIKLAPSSPLTDLSLYAYAVGPQNKDTLPPNVNSVVSCEASAGSKLRKHPFNPGGTEQVKLRASRNPYHVLIGVTGAQKLKTGAFRLELELKKR